MMPDNASPGREWTARPERVFDPFRVRVKGRDAAGNVFKVSTVLDNISAGGLFVRLDREVRGGAPLSLFVSFSTLPPEASNAPRLCARGVVLRAEVRPDGLYGVAVAFTRHRFLKVRSSAVVVQAPPFNVDLRPD